MTPQTIQKRERLTALFCGENNKKDRISSEVEHAIYTIGYQEMKVDDFLRFLFNSGIKRIIDVRKNPLSRVYGFNKNTLSLFANRLEIEYVHRPDLGVPSEWRKNLNKPKDYESLFNRYKSEVLAQSENALHEISQMMGSMPSVLMCWEANPSFCHRNCLAESISMISHMKIHDLRVANEERI